MMIFLCYILVNNVFNIRFEILLCADTITEKLNFICFVCFYKFLMII